MKLTAVFKCDLVDMGYKDTGIQVQPYEQVEYGAHMVGGNIRIIRDGKEYIAHPAAFKELR